jgi:hypothetical protein
VLLSEDEIINDICHGPVSPSPTLILCVIVLQFFLLCHDYYSIRFEMLSVGPIKIASNLQLCTFFICYNYVHVKILEPMGQMI